MKLIICLLLTLAAMLAITPTAVNAAPADPASAVVTQFLDARAAGNRDAAYALITKNMRDTMLPGPQDTAAVLTHFDDPKTFGKFNAQFRALIALMIDFKNTLRYKFRVLGPDPADHAVVLLRAYRVGTPLSSITTVKIVTAPDPAANNAPRIDIEQTLMRADPAFARDRGRAQQASSLSNEKQICLCILMYAQDHDNHFPDADRWVDEIMPYLKTEAPFHDPSAPAGEKWSYAYNRNLSGAKLADVASPSATVMVFESAAGTKNASDTGASVPRPGRHDSGTDYAFADGHCVLIPDTAPPPSFLLAAP